MSLHYRIEENQLVIMGKTYPYKDEIRTHGGRWNGSQKVWQIPLNDSTLQAVDSMCKKAGGGCVNPDQQPTTPAATSAKSTIDSASNAKQNEEQSDSLSVGQLMEQLAQTVAKRFAFPIWLHGEIQNLNPRKGNLFLQLAEAQGSSQHGAATTISAQIWQNTLQKMRQKHTDADLEALLTDGTQVRVLCQVSLYKGRGQVSVTIQDVDPNFTKGQLALAREKLIKELRAAGLYDRNRSRPLSAFPLKVALITATGSRAYSDFCHQLESGGYCGSVDFFEAAMQGESVTTSVPEALSRASTADLIVLTRGGGSAADLRWFDTPEVAHAIAQCPVPVLAAIGHHEDTCVAEMVAFDRAKTPTAAAEWILAVLAQTRERIDQSSLKMAALLDRMTVYHQRKMQNLAGAISLKAQQSLEPHNQTLSALAGRIHNECQHRHQNRLHALTTFGRELHRESLHTLSKLSPEALLLFPLESAIERFFNRSRESLLTAESDLKSKDPQKWLAGGWTRLEGLKKSASTADIKAGDELHARLLDGLVYLKVQKVVSKTDP